MKSKKKPKKKPKILKLFSVVKIRGNPCKGMYGFIVTKADDEYEVMIANDEDLITFNYQKEDLRKMKLENIKDADLRQRIRKGIEIENEKLVENEI